LRAKLPRRNAGNSAEGAGKVRRISVSGGECDFDNLGIRVAQKLAGTLEPNAIEQI
jgi:hypothetical protein